MLGVMTIFDDAVTAQQLSIAAEIGMETAASALDELVDVTLVNRTIQQSDGRVLYSALPITLTFARNELGKMGDFEVRARQRVQQFNDQMELQAGEVARFTRRV